MLKILIILKNSVIFSIIFFSAYKLRISILLFHYGVK